VTALELTPDRMAARACGNVSPQSCATALTDPPALLGLTLQASSARPYTFTHSDSTPSLSRTGLASGANALGHRPQLSLASPRLWG
jgi:hypothetical protein